MAESLADCITHREAPPNGGRPLRIAQLAPLYESVPPSLYGGTERVVAYLTDELVHRGHQVTLFASGDSRTRGSLRPVWPRSLRLSGMTGYGPNYNLLMLSEAYEHAATFDVIHCHVDYWAMPFARLVATPSVTTLHGRLDTINERPIYHNYRDLPVVSISDAQRKPLPFMNWIGTVQHGLPRELLKFNPGPGRYLAFLGRISPEKRPDLAIAVARRTGIPLKIAAKVDEQDRDYFRQVVEPLLAPPDVEYIGEIDDAHKSEFLGNALALLFTIDWPEPFGLVMIESLACGTPVIARPCGSVPEVLRDGVSGLFATDLDDLVRAVKRVESLSRRACRDEFERRFTSEVMAANYERLYRQLAGATCVGRGSAASSSSNVTSTVAATGQNNECGFGVRKTTGERFDS